MDMDDQGHRTSPSPRCSDNGVGCSSFSLLTSSLTSCQSNYSSTRCNNSGEYSNNNTSSSGTCSTSGNGCDCPSKTNGGSCQSYCISNRRSNCSDNETCCSQRNSDGRPSNSSSGSNYYGRTSSSSPSRSHDIPSDSSSSTMQSHSDSGNAWSRRRYSSPTCHDEPVEQCSTDDLSTRVLVTPPTRSLERRNSHNSSSGSTTSNTNTAGNAGCNVNDNGSSNNRRSYGNNGGANGGSTKSSSRVTSSSLTPISSPSSSRDSNGMCLRRKLGCGRQAFAAVCSAAEAAAAAGADRPRRRTVRTGEEEDAAASADGERPCRERPRRAPTAAGLAACPEEQRIHSGRADEQEAGAAAGEKEEEEEPDNESVKKGRQQVQQQQQLGSTAGRRNIGTATSRIGSTSRGNKEEHKQEEEEQQQQQSTTREATYQGGRGGKAAEASTNVCSARVCSYSLRNSLRRRAAPSPLRRAPVVARSSSPAGEATRRSAAAAAAAAIPTAPLTRAAAARLSPATAARSPRAAPGRGQRAAASPSTRRNLSIGGAAGEGRGSGSRSRSSRSRSSRSRSRSRSNSGGSSSSSGKRKTSDSLALRSSTSSSNDGQRTDDSNSRSRREWDRRGNTGGAPTSNGSGSSNTAYNSYTNRNSSNRRSRSISDSNTSNGNGAGSSRRTNPRRACRSGDPVPCGLEWTRRLVAAAKEKAAAIAWSTTDSPSMRELLKVRQEPQRYVGLGLYLEKPLRTCSCSIWQALQQQQQQEPSTQQNSPTGAPGGGADGGETRAAGSGRETRGAVAARGAAEGGGGGGAGLRRAAEGTGTAAAAAPGEEGVGREAGEGMVGQAAGMRRNEHLAGFDGDGLEGAAVHHGREQRRYGNCKNSRRESSSSNIRKREAFTADECAAMMTKQQQHLRLLTSPEKLCLSALPLEAAGAGEEGGGRGGLVTAAGRAAEEEATETEDKRMIEEIEQIEGGKAAAEDEGGERKKHLQTSAVGRQMSSRRSSSCCNSPSSGGCSVASTNNGETLKSNRRTTRSSSRSNSHQCTTTNTSSISSKKGCGCSEEAGGFRVLCFRGDVVLSPHNDRSAAPLLSAEEKQLIYDPQENPGIEPASHLSPAFTLSSLEIPFSFQLQANRYLLEGREEEVKAIYANHYCATHCSAFFDINASGTPCIVTRPGADIPAGPFGVFYGWSRSSSFPCAQEGCGHVCQPRCPSCFSAEMQWRKCWRMHRRFAVPEAAATAVAEGARAGGSRRGGEAGGEEGAGAGGEIPQRELVALSGGGRGRRRESATTQQQQLALWEDHPELVPPLCFSEEDEDGKEEEEEEKNTKQEEKAKPGPVVKDILPGKAPGALPKAEETQQQRLDAFEEQQDQQQELPQQLSRVEQQRRKTAQQSKLAEEESKKIFTLPRAVAEYKCMHPTAARLTEGAAAAAGRYVVSEKKCIPQAEGERLRETRPAEIRTTAREAARVQGRLETTAAEEQRGAAAAATETAAAEQKDAQKSRFFRRTKGEPGTEEAAPAVETAEPSHDRKTDTEGTRPASASAATHAIANATAAAPTTAEAEGTTMVEPEEEELEQRRKDGRAGWPASRRQIPTSSSCCPSVGTGQERNFSSCIQGERGGGVHLFCTGDSCMCRRTGRHSSSGQAAAAGEHAGAAAIAKKAFAVPRDAALGRVAAEGVWEGEQPGISRSRRPEPLSSSKEQLLLHAACVCRCRGNYANSNPGSCASQTTNDKRDVLAAIAAGTARVGTGAGCRSTAAAAGEAVTLAAGAPVAARTLAEERDAAAAQGLAALVAQEERTEGRERRGSSRTRGNAEERGPHKRVQRVWEQQAEKRSNRSKAMDFPVQLHAEENKTGTSGGCRAGADVVATVQAAVAVLRAAAAAEAERRSPQETSRQLLHRSSPENTSAESQGDERASYLGRLAGGDSAARDDPPATALGCQLPQEWGRKRLRTQKEGGEEQEEEAAPAARMRALNLLSSRIAGAAAAPRLPAQGAVPTPASAAAGGANAAPVDLCRAHRLLAQELAMRIRAAAAPSSPTEASSAAGTAGARPCAAGRCCGAASSLLLLQEQSRRRRLLEQQERQRESEILRAASAAAAVLRERGAALRAPSQPRQPAAAGHAAPAAGRNPASGPGTGPPPASTCQQHREGDIALIEAAALLDADPACGAAFAALAAVVPLASPAYLRPLPPLLPRPVGPPRGEPSSNEVCGNSSKCLCVNRCSRSNCCCSCCRNVRNMSWSNSRRCNASCSCNSAAERRFASAGGCPCAAAATAAAALVSGRLPVRPAAGSAAQGGPHRPSPPLQTDKTPAATEATTEEGNGQRLSTAALLVDAATRLLLSLGAAASTEHNNSDSNSGESPLPRW